MGQRRKTRQGPHGADVHGSIGVLDPQEKEAEEQKALVHCLLCTVHHFFGGFSPFILHDH